MRIFQIEQRTIQPQAPEPIVVFVAEWKDIFDVRQMCVYLHHYTPAQG